MKASLAEILIAVGLGLLFGSILLGYPPEPPPGICDAQGSPEQCTEWWLNIMERP